jgi:hypothetical protein
MNVLPIYYIPVSKIVPVPCKRRERRRIGTIFVIYFGNGTIFVIYFGIGTIYLSNFPYYISENR